MNYGRVSSSNMKMWPKLMLVCLYVYVTECKLRIIKSEMCEKKTPMELYVNIVGYNDTVQWGLGNYSSPIDNGSNMRAAFHVFANIQNKWLKMFEILTESGMCNSLNMYVGEFWHHIQRNMNMTPGKCPFAAGTYVLKELLVVDLKKMKFQTLPRGKMRFEFELHHKKSNQLMMCMITEAENL